MQREGGSGQARNMIYCFFLHSGAGCAHAQYHRHEQRTHFCHEDVVHGDGVVRPACALALQLAYFPHFQHIRRLRPTPPTPQGSACALLPSPFSPVSIFLVVKYTS